MFHLKGLWMFQVSVYPQYQAGATLTKHKCILHYRDGINPRSSCNANQRLASCRPDGGGSGEGGVICSPGKQETFEHNREGLFL